MRNWTYIAAILIVHSEFVAKEMLVITNIVFKYKLQPSDYTY